MPHVNQCDINCPRAAFIGAEYQQSVEDVGAVKKIGLACAAGVAGINQMLRAAHCPQRNVTLQDWVPQERCIEDVRSGLIDHPLDADSLTEHQRNILEPYLK